MDRRRFEVIKNKKGELEFEPSFPSTGGIIFNKIKNFLQNPSRDFAFREGDLWIADASDDDEIEIGKDKKGNPMKVKYWIAKNVIPKHEGLTYHGDEDSFEILDGKFFYYASLYSNKERNFEVTEKVQIKYWDNYDEIISLARKGYWGKCKVAKTAEIDSPLTGKRLLKDFSRVIEPDYLLMLVEQNECPVIFEKFVSAVNEARENMDRRVEKEKKEIEYYDKERNDMLNQGSNVNTDDKVKYFIENSVICMNESDNDPRMSLRGNENSVYKMGKVVFYFNYNEIDEDIIDVKDFKCSSDGWTQEELINFANWAINKTMPGLIDVGGLQKIIKKYKSEQRLYKAIIDEKRFTEIWKKEQKEKMQEQINGMPNEKDEIIYESKYYQIRAIGKLYSGVNLHVDVEEGIGKKDNTIWKSSVWVAEIYWDNEYHIEFKIDTHDDIKNWFSEHFQFKL